VGSAPAPAAPAATQAPAAPAAATQAPAAPAAATQASAAPAAATQASAAPAAATQAPAAPTAASAAAAPAAAIPVLGDLKVDKKIKIGVTMKFDDLWLTTMRDAMNEYAKSLGSNVEMVFVDSKDDSATQLSQVENFVTQKLDAIVIVPADTDATDPMSQAVLAAKIPLVYVNRKPSNLPASAAFVASQSIDAGIFQME
jgi:inositol transport system substrate-binding protein